MIFKPKKIRDILIHVGAMLVIALSIVLIFFNWYLPNVTNHGETITVPDLEGRQIDDIETYLSERGLLYEVSADSGFSVDHQPLTVLKQYPNPQTLVKEKRKIYLTLNAKNPPKVNMPELIDLSVKIAKIKLESLGLLIGEIKYEPDMAFNAVLKQLYDGEEIEEGTPIFKGSEIDLVVGDGYGNREFPVPDLLGMSLDNVEILLAGQGLKTGSIIEAIAVENDTLPMGTIVRQTPEFGESIRIGEVVDIWVVEYEKYKATLEDEENNDANR